MSNDYKKTIDKVGLCDAVFVSIQQFEIAVDNLKKVSLSAAEAAIEQRQQQIELRSSQYQMLQEQHDNLSSKQRELRKAIDKTREERQELMREAIDHPALTDLEQERDRVEEQLSDLRKKLVESTAKVAIKKRQQQAELRSGQHRILQVEYDALFNKKDELRQAIDKMYKDDQELRREIIDHSALTDLERERDRVEEQLSDLRKKLVEYKLNTGGENE